MNPPYERNLHLKIVAEAITHLKDNSSKCINLSPIRWLQDPHAQYKQRTDIHRFENSILKKLESLDIIDAKQCNNEFGIYLYANLGIYVTSNGSVKKFDYKSIWKNSYTQFEIDLLNKIYKHSTHLSDKIEVNKKDGIRVPICLIAGGRGELPIYKDLDYVIDGLRDGKDWTECKNNKSCPKVKNSPLPNSIKFNSVNEAENFYSSCKTKFYRYIAKRFITDQNIQIRFLPYMEDYTKPWTDEDFYKFFNITPEEQIAIESCMNKK